MRLLTKLIVISIAGVFAFSGARSQEYPSELALRFSQINTGGSARIMGLGGVNTSLGGDISSVSLNPAGLGFYNRSEISLTPIIDINSNNTSYLGNGQSTTKTRFHMGNLGVAINNSKADAIPGPWRGGTFGFSYNRINDFHQEVLYSGTNVDNDYIDFLLEYGNSTGSQVDDTYLLDLPFNTYLINDYSVQQPGDTTFGVWDSFVEFATPDQPVRQSEQIIRSGYQNKWDISYGGNFSDRFYFGLGLGIVTLNYINEKTYREDRYPESILNNFTLYERQEIDGVGVNGNFGIIVRPINTLTLGINFVTPTAISVTDEFVTSMNTIWNDNADEVFENEPGFTGDHYDETELEPLTYSISTPMRLNFGASYFFNKNGFISADLEWVDYSKASVHSNNTDLSIDNSEINSNYASVLNYRLGGEYRADIFRFRAGFNFQGDPMAIDTGIDRNRYSYSAGMGIRKRSFYADFTYVYSITEDQRAPYTIDPAQEIGPTPVADINYNQSQLVFSFGFMF